MILQKTYKCQKCDSEFIKSESERVIKSILPACPICGSSEVKLEKTLVVGKKPGY